MNASKNRPRWHQLPPLIRAAIERLIGGAVVHARNCPGGYSPGFASVLSLADGRRVFVKAIDADRWSFDAAYYRVEAKVSAALPATIAAPRLLGTFDNDHWTVLAFEAVEGIEPPQPWRDSDLNRVVAAVIHLGQVGTPSPIALARDHPRLGGWAAVAGNPAYLAQLARHSTWAVDHLPGLIGLERAGLAAAQGDSLVHFGLAPHNVLLTPDRVIFVDWPGARLGAPVIDLITVLASAAAGQIDRESVLDNYYPRARFEPEIVDAILAAHTGFQLLGGISPKPPGLKPIQLIELELGRCALAWLQHRLARRS